jgi:hypothetical protein
VPTRPGLPPGWPEIADRIRTKTGRELLLRQVPEPFSDGSQSVEISLDGRFIGQFDFWWSDDEPAEAPEELRNVLSIFLDEELRTEDW